jgi:hypothetical protein
VLKKSKGDPYIFFVPVRMERKVVSLSVVLKLDIKASSFKEMNFNLFKFLLRNPEKYPFLKIETYFPKWLKCTNPLKYFKCNHFSLLVLLIWCPKRSVSFKSSLIWVYFILKLCKKSNLQNWNIIFI